jgi:hypothetical protein
MTTLSVQVFDLLADLARSSFQLTIPKLRKDSSLSDSELKQISSDLNHRIDSERKRSIPEITKVLTNFPGFADFLKANYKSFSASAIAPAIEMEVPKVPLVTLTASGEPTDQDMDCDDDTEGDDDDDDLILDWLTQIFEIYSDQMMKLRTDGSCHTK